MIYYQYSTFDLEGNEMAYQKFPFHEQIYSYMMHAMLNKNNDALLLMSHQLKAHSPRYYQQTIDKLFHHYFTQIYPHQNELILTFIQMGVDVSLSGEFALRKTLNLSHFEDAQKLINAGAQLRSFIHHFLDRASLQCCTQSIDFVLANHINLNMYLHNLVSSYPKIAMNEKSFSFLTYLEQQGINIQEVMPSLFEETIKELNYDLAHHIIHHYSISLPLIQSSLEDICFFNSNKSIEQRSQMITLLVSKGANPNTVKDNTPLYYFPIIHKQHELFHTLTQYGLELNDPNIIMTALHKGNKDTIHFVLKHQTFDEDNWQKFLLLSIRNGDSFLIDSFITQGFPLDFENCSAFTEALNYNEPSIAFYLIEKGMDVNTHDSQFLLYAIEKENLNLIEQIYSLGGHLPIFDAYNLSHISENVLSYVNLLEGKYQLQQQLNNNLPSQLIKNQPKI